MLLDKFLPSNFTEIYCLKVINNTLYKSELINENLKWKKSNLLKQGKF